MKATGMNWYRDSRRAIKRNYGKDWKLFAALVAATSPRQTVKGNITVARKAYYQIKETGTIRRDSFLYAHYKSILAVIEKGIPNGRKCRDLYYNLIGDEAHVPVDMWMYRMAYPDSNRIAPRKHEYDYIEDRVKEEAENMGITTAQRQAQLWVKIRGNAGSYADALAQRPLF